MRRLLRISAGCLFVALLCVAVLTTNAGAYSPIRPESRAGTWDLLLPIVYAESAAINGQGGSGVEINSDWGFGVGYGYNLSNHFQLNGLFSWNLRSFDATIVQDDGTTRRYNNWMDAFTLSVNGTYYLLKGNITPFVSGGIGMTYVETNFQNGVASTACWWDPWWGRLCGGFIPGRTENALSYNAGIGIRLDITPRFGLQPSYNKTWVDFDNASGTPDFEIWRLDLIFQVL